MDDTKLPTSRPEKYSWMIHAERNALSNCVVRPDDGIAYITGQCCNDCIKALWQEGVTEVHMIDAHGTQLFDNTEKKHFDLFVESTNIGIFYETPDLSWIHNI